MGSKSQLEPRQPHSRNRWWDVGCLYFRRGFVIHHPMVTPDGFLGIKTGGNELRNLRSNRQVIKLDENSGKRNWQLRDELSSFRDRLKKNQK